MDDAGLTLHTGGPERLEWLLGLFDEAVAWMVARGQPEQWGSEPWSSSPARRTQVAELIAGGGLRVGRWAGEDAGALVLGSAPAHVPAIDEPELYIELLLVSRAHAGLRIGEWLVERAIGEARAGAVEVVRVDCWADAPTLVGWYLARGFRRAGTFAVERSSGPWRGQIFAMRV